MAASFQDHTDKLISSKKSEHCGINEVIATIYYCVYHSGMHITITCLNTKDNIYFVIIFSQFLRNDRFSWFC